MMNRLLRSNTSTLARASSWRRAPSAVATGDTTAAVLATCPRWPQHLSSSNGVEQNITNRCVAVVLRSLYRESTFLEHAASTSEVDDDRFALTRIVMQKDGLMDVVALLMAYGASGPWLPLRLMGRPIEPTPLMDAEGYVPRSWCRALIHALATSAEQEPVAGVAQEEHVFVALSLLALCEGEQDVQSWIHKYFSGQESMWQSHRLDLVMCLLSAFRMVDGACTHCKKNPVESVVPAERVVTLCEALVGNLDCLVEEVPFTHVASVSAIAQLLSAANRSDVLTRLVCEYHASNPTVSLPNSVYDAVFCHAIKNNVLLSQTVPTRRGFGDMHTLSKGGYDETIPLFDPHFFVTLLRSHRASYQRQVATLNRFERGSVDPVMIGDPVVMGWTLSFLSTLHSSHEGNARLPLTQRLSLIQEVAQCVEIPCIIRRCVPVGVPLEELMIRCANDQRRRLASGMICGLLDAVALCVHVVAPDNAMLKRKDETLGCVVTCLCELLNRWQAKMEREKVPKWRRRLPSNCQVRSHKMEILREELPQGEFAKTIWLLLQSGSVKEAFTVTLTLLKCDLMDIHYFPLAIFASIRSSVRVHPELIVDSADLALIRSAYLQRYHIFGDSSNSDILMDHRLAAPVPTSSSSSLVPIVPNREAVVYPLLAAIKQSTMVSSLGTVSFSNTKWRQVGGTLL